MYLFKCLGMHVKKNFKLIRLPVIPASHVQYLEESQSFMLLPVDYANLRQKNPNLTCIITILWSLASISQIATDTLFNSVVYAVVLYPGAANVGQQCAALFSFFLLFFDCLFFGELQTSLRINIAPFSVRICRCQVNKKNLAWCTAQFATDNK